MNNQQTKPNWRDRKAAMAAAPVQTEWRVEKNPDGDDLHILGGNFFNGIPSARIRKHKASGKWGLSFHSTKVARHNVPGAATAFDSLEEAKARGRDELVRLGALAA